MKQWFHKNVNDIAAFHFYLTKINLLLMNDYREGEFFFFFEKNKMKKTELKKLTNEMCPYFEECFKFDASSTGFFKKEYHWSSGNRVDCSYSHLTLQEIIDNNKYVRRLNCTNNLYKFTYSEFLNFFIVLKYISIL